MQSLLPPYLSKSSSIDLERVNFQTGYTPLLSVCNSTYDPYGNKVSAIKLLIENGASTRVCCNTFGNSTLHLALLSARNEVRHDDGKLWRGDSEQLRQVLVWLLRDHAEVGGQNNAGLSPADVAIGLKCVKTWNDAMRVCGYSGQVVDVPYSVDLFSQDIYKQHRVDKWWEDYHHFSDWGCRPNTCTRQAGGSRRKRCPWWEENQVELLKWDDLFTKWEEL